MCASLGSAVVTSVAVVAASAVKAEFFERLPDVTKSKRENREEKMKSEISMKQAKNEEEKKKKRNDYNRRRPFFLFVSRFLLVFVLVNVCVIFFFLAVIFSFHLL